jgi:N-acetylmuramoyl-L-alanine amidase
MTKYSIFTVIALSLILVFSIWFTPSPLSAVLKSQLASVFFTDSIDASDLKEKYDDRKKIKILIVPGHDPEKFGTSYGELKEFNLNLELATYLYEDLKKNDRFKVGLAQTADGYQPQISSHISKNENRIWSYVAMKKNIMNNLISTGLVTENTAVNHNFASNDIALKLHGINSYANQNDIDIVIHVHFNDYPGRQKDSTFKYSGFAVYLPEKQYSNARASWDIGPYISETLATEFTPSNHPLESTILVPDQELIAIGSFNTLDAVALLVEYGYIYESHIGKADPKTRSKTLKKMASLTADGLERFFKD